MGVSPRLLSLVGGLAVACGLAVLAGPAVASADDGTGEPAPGPSSAGPASDDAVAPPLKAPPPMPTMELGNGRQPGAPGSTKAPSKAPVGNGRTLGQFDGGGGSGIGDVPTGSSGAYGASSQQAEAEEAEEMAELLSTQKDKETEFMTEMQDFASQVNSLAGTMADNAPQPRSEYPG